MVTVTEYVPRGIDIDGLRGFPGRPEVLIESGARIQRRTDIRTERAHFRDIRTGLSFSTTSTESDPLHPFVSVTDTL